jgi:hypothetical protein
MGRIAFDIQCQQLEHMSLEINSIKCKLIHCFKNELSFRVRYLNSHVCMETEYTNPVKGEINNKDDNTIYKWSEEDSGVQTYHLKIDKLLLSVNELRQCNLEIRLFEVIYELNDERKASSNLNGIESDNNEIVNFINFPNDNLNSTHVRDKILSEGMVGTEQSNYIKNESLFKTRENADLKRSRNSKFKELTNLDERVKINYFGSTNNLILCSQFKSQNHAVNEGSDFKSNSIHFEKIPSTDRIPRSKSKKIIRENVTEKFDPLNEKILIKHERSETSTLEVKPHYNEVGYSRVNFYNVLAQQDNIILSQSSRVFHKFSYLYQGDNKFNNVYDNLTGSPNLTRERRTNSAFYIHRNDEKITSLSSYRKGSVEVETKLSNCKKNLERNQKKLLTQLPHGLTDDPSFCKVHSADRCLTEEKENVAQTEIIGYKPSINEKSILDLLGFQLFNEIKKSYFKQEILLNGNVIGELEGTISINHIPMIRQMVCGVHTERGLDISDNFLFNCLSHNEQHHQKNEQKEIIISETISNQSLPEEIQKISNLTSKIISKMINNTSVTTNPFAMREISMQVSGILKEILSLIEKTHITDKGPNYLIYDYKYEYDLIRSQSILLELGLNLIHMIDTLNNEARGLCCQILEILNEREEFSLSSMAMLANDLSQVENDLHILYSPAKKKEKLKVKVVEDYLDFTLKTLDYTLQKLSSKVRDEKTKNFIESFLAVAYMRVPKFQIAFLEAVNKNVKLIALNSDNQLTKDDDAMGHLSTTHPSLMAGIGAHNFAQSSQNLKVKLTAFPTLAYSNTLSHLENPNGQNEVVKNASPALSVIDWQFLFYEKIEKSPNLNLSDKLQELDEIIHKKYTWQERISKRGLGFFYVVSHIANYVFKKLGKDTNINWLEMPGFKIIINSIIYELSIKEVHAYPKPLTDILVIFINDYGIMNKFYKIIVGRTNVYDSQSVFRAIKILDSFFEEYERKKDICDFSYKFDYNLIKKAANAIFAVDHSVCVSKLIWLYYKNTHLMNIVHVHEIFSECFKPKFFSLFFHWSWQVRNILYYFIWFVINHRLKNKKFITEQSILCKERLEYLSNKDDVGFFKAFNTDYPEEVKIYFILLKIKILFF